MRSGTVSNNQLYTDLIFQSLVVTVHVEVLITNVLLCIRVLIVESDAVTVHVLLKSNYVQLWLTDVLHIFLGCVTVDSVL